MESLAEEEVGRAVGRGGSFGTSTAVAADIGREASGVGRARPAREHRFGRQ